MRHFLVIFGTYQSTYKLIKKLARIPKKNSHHSAVMKISCATLTKPLAQLCQESMNAQRYFPKWVVQFMLIELRGDK